MSQPRYASAPSNRQFGRCTDVRARSTPVATSTNQAGQLRCGNRRTSQGIASTTAVAIRPPAIGLAVRSTSSCRPPPNASQTPPPTSATMLIALVRKNSALERSTMLLTDMPVRRKNHPPMARAPTPPPGNSAPDPSSTQATSRARPPGAWSKKSRKITTKPTHDASSRTTDAAIHAG